MMSQGSSDGVLEILAASLGRAATPRDPVGRSHLETRHES